jgi:hypothetical protein
LNLQRLCAVILLALGAGCATVETPHQAQPGPASSEGALCVKWFEQLDATIDRAGVRDAGAYRIPGFPYLRVDRFTASFRDQANDTPQAFDAWLARLQALGSEARQYEIANLPARYFPVDGSGDPAAARTKSQACAERLAREDFVDTARRELLAARAQVPDNYSSLKRVLGLYPLAIIPFSNGVDKWHKEASEMFAKAAAGPTPAAGVVRYEAATRSVNAGKVSALFSRLKPDALGVPQFTDEERDLLLEAYAPAFEIETTGEYDRFGPLLWRADPAPAVDTMRPTAYRRLAFTRYYSKTLVQLVYTVWFPERPSSGATDLLAGRLDGIVFRVTLGADGAPLVYDTMHPCGCYHMFFPTARVTQLPAQQPVIEWAFVPSKLPALAVAQRVAVQIASRTHYVVGVHADTGAPGTAYQFADDNDLRALPAAGDGTRSAFGPDGIVPGTERGERLYFWPMGIDNSGAMRQWGNHATAFVGRRHFDDAVLIERRFEVVPTGQMTSVAPQ